MSIDVWQKNIFQYAFRFIQCHWRNLDFIINNLSVYNGADHHPSAFPADKGAIGGPGKKIFCPDFEFTIQIQEG
jgi:hypothetical protein